MHGSSISLFSMIYGLKKHDVEISLVVPTNWPRNQPFIDKIEELGITLHYAHIVQTYDGAGWSRKPWKIRTFYRELKELVHQRKVSYRQICNIVEEVKPDIIHTNVGVIHDGFWAARKYKIPHVFHIREYQDKDFGWKILPTKRLFEIMLNKSSAVVTITDEIRRHFHLLLNNNSCTIYNGIYSKDEITYIPNKEKYFLCASRISPEKGCDEVIKAFSKFYRDHQDYTLRFAGDVTPIYENQLKTLAKELKCEDGVLFLGYRSDVKALIQHAKAIVVASYNEGFGRMTAEAALQGCLVIGRNTAGTKEIMDKVGGMPFDNIEELFNAMSNSIDISNDDYSLKVLRSQEKALSLYTTEKNVEKIYCLYKSLMNTK